MRILGPQFGIIVKRRCVYDGIRSGKLVVMGEGHSTIRQIGIEVDGLEFCHGAESQNTGGRTTIHQRIS